MKFDRKCVCTQVGFTLLEVMVAVVVLGIMAATMGSFSYHNARQNKMASERVQAANMANKWMGIWIEGGVRQSSDGGFNVAYTSTRVQGPVDPAILQPTAGALSYDCQRLAVTATSTNNISCTVETLVRN